MDIDKLFQDLRSFGPIYDAQTEIIETAIRELRAELRAAIDALRPFAEVDRGYAVSVYRHARAIVAAYEAQHPEVK